jgi:hypothetical protein
MPKVLKSPWRESVIAALVTKGIYDPKRHDADAKTAVADLIVGETEQALDPAISLEARKLVSSVSGELLRWKGGDWCDTCNAPQLVLPNGEHRCMPLADLQKAYLNQLQSGYALSRKLREAERLITALEKQLNGS